MAQPATAPGLDTARPDFYRQLLRDMLLIRRFEERAGEAYAQGKIGGFCHLYIGQEAVAVGSSAALRDDDYLFCSYREHGQALARGLTPREVMAELFGKATGSGRQRMCDSVSSTTQPAIEANLSGGRLRLEVDATTEICTAAS